MFEELADLKLQLEREGIYSRCSIISDKGMNESVSQWCG